MSAFFPNAAGGGGVQCFLTAIQQMTVNYAKMRSMTSPGSIITQALMSTQVLRLGDFCGRTGTENREQ